MTDQHHTERQRGRPRPASRARGLLDDAERTAIRDLAREGHSAREVARRTGRSTTTVSKYAGDLLAERHEQVAAAVEAQRLTGGVRRGEQAERLLDDLDAARRMLAEQGDPQRAMWAARVLTAVVGAHVRLVEADRGAAGGDHSDVDHYLSVMVGQAAPDAVAQYLPDDGPGPAT